MLQFQPACIYLKFENWTVCEGTNIRARRRGFTIVPDFNRTAHSVQGASFLSAIVDCLTVDHCPKFSDMLAAYIGLSRIKFKELLLIAQAFSPALFCQGQPPGPESLMKVLRREITADDAKKDHVRTLARVCSKHRFLLSFGVSSSDL